MYYFKHQNVLINILLLYCVHSIYIAKINIQNHSPYIQAKSDQKFSPKYRTRWLLNWLLAYWFDMKFEIPEISVHHCQNIFSNTNEKHVQSVEAIILPSSISTYKLALLEPWQQLSPKSTIFQCQYQIPWRRDACRYKT